MIVLSRQVGQRLVIGKHITVRVIGVQGQQVRLGIEAPEVRLAIEAPTWVRIRTRELAPLNQPKDAGGKLSPTYDLMSTF